MSTWDGPSTFVSWVVGLAGSAFALVAAQACHARDTAPTIFLLLSALCTIQLLGFVATCFAYRFWVVTSTRSPRLGPGQAEPRVRRGLPALNSNGRYAGMDIWSFVVIGLLVAPIAVPPLMLHRPTEKLRFTSANQELLGIAKATPADKQRNGAKKSTTGSYEAITLALQTAIIDGTLSINMLNTASTAINASINRVYAPPHVPAACMYPEVTAKNVTALVGNYACDNSKRKAETNCTGGGASIAKNKGCIAFSNYTIPTSPVAYLIMEVQHSDMQVKCNVSYALAKVDVTWHGIDKDFPSAGRNCRIKHLKELKYIDMTKEDWARYGNASSDLVNYDYINPLRLPLWNAFYHTIGHGKVADSNTEAINDFYGAVMAAGAMLRTTGEQFDPTTQNVASDTTEVRYAAHICHQYGWSGLTIFLLAANILLIGCGTLISSGMQTSIRDVRDSIFNHRNAAPEDPAKPDEAGNGGPAGLLNSMTSIQTSQPSQPPSNGSVVTATAVAH